MRRRNLIFTLCTIALLSGATLVLCEITFRLLLFSKFEFMQKFRSPDLYASYDSEDNYWKLYYLFGGKFGPPANPHPELGWIGKFSRDTYVHDHATDAGSRTPVLLYGDSFAECSTIPNKQECFEGLFNGDPAFSRHHYLLNYGVGSYGLDQVFLLLRGSLRHYKDPFVIVGIMTWDLDRSAHSVRIGQKPFFQVEDEALVLKGVPINQKPDEFFRLNPPNVWSYLLRLWALGDGPFWRVRQAIQGVQERQRNMEGINEKILVEIIRHLRRQGAPHMFVIFYPSWVYQDPADWREVLIKRVLDENGESYFSTRELVFEDAKRLGKNPKVDYYSDDHPTAYQYKLIAERIKPYILSNRESVGAH